MKRFPSHIRFIRVKFSRTEFMEPLGLSSYRLAKELHVSAPRINEILREKRALTADTALRLATYFGNSPQFWMTLQMDHDLWVAAQNPSLAEVRPREQAADSDPLQPWRKPDRLRADGAAGHQHAHRLLHAQVGLRHPLHAAASARKPRSD